MRFSVLETLDEFYGSKLHIYLINLTNVYLNHLALRNSFVLTQ